MWSDVYFKQWTRDIVLVLTTGRILFVGVEDAAITIPELAEELIYWPDSCPAGAFAELT